MSPEPEDRHGHGDDRALIEEIDAAWQPQPLDPVGGARFDARLRERIEADGGRMHWGLRPAFATVALVALFAWGLWPEPNVPEANAWEIAEWEWEVLLGGDDGEEATGSHLPEEYALIETLFLNP